MSLLLFCDSFAHFTVDQMDSNKWDKGSVDPTSAIVVGKYIGSRAFTGIASKTFLDDTETAQTYSEICVGFNWSIKTGIFSDLPISIVGTGITAKIINNGDNTFTPRVTVGVTDHDGPKTTFVHAVGDWHYYEYQFLINTGAGTIGVLLNVDGVNIITYSWSVASSAVFSNISCDSTGGAVADLYVTDGLMLAPLRILVVNPKANGDTDQLTPNDAGTDNWNMVKEVPPDEDTTYNASSTSAKDLYQTAAISILPTPFVRGVQICARARNLDGDDAEVKLSVVTPSLVDEPAYPKTEWDYPATGKLILRDTNYHYLLKQLLSNPTSSDNWVMEQINALQIGFILNPGSAAITVPSGVYQLQLGCNCDNNYNKYAGYPNPGSIGNYSAGVWNIRIVGPKTGGGTQTKDVTITLTPGTFSGQPGYGVPPPWIQDISGQVPTALGHQRASADIKMNPVVVTQDDGFAFNAGDVITITYRGGYLVSYPFNCSVNDPAFGSASQGFVESLAYYKYLGNVDPLHPQNNWSYDPLTVNQANWTPFGIGSNYKNFGPGSWSGSPPGLILVPGGDTTRYSTTHTSFPASKCDQTTGPIGIGGLIGCFAGVNQITSPSIVPGSGLVVGTPFMISFGGTFTVGNP